MNIRICSLYFLFCLASTASAQYRLTGDREKDEAFRKRVQQGIDHARQRQYEQALDDWIWCLDFRSGTYPEFLDNPTNYLVTNLHMLGKYHTPADDALKKRRARAEKRLKKGTGDFNDAHEYDEINRAYGDWYRTLELYDSLEDKGKKAEQTRELLFLFVEEPLLEAERYDELLEGGKKGPANLQRRFDILKSEADMMRNQLGDAQLNNTKTLLCRSAGRYYQAMLATKKTKRAAAMADEFLAFHPKGEAFEIFMDHAIKAKKYKTAHRLAEKARAILPSEDYAVVRKALERIPKKKLKRPVSRD